MFPSGSFAVALQCSHQCDHSVPGLEILKEPSNVPKMFQISTFAVSWECSCSVPLLGKFWGHCKQMPGKLQNLEHLKCACSVPRISPNFPKSGTLQEHSQDTANVLIRNIFRALLWFFQNF